MVVSALIDGASDASTVTVPPTRSSTSLPSGIRMYASAPELTLLVATTMLAAAPPSALASLLVAASIVAVTAAVTDRSPPTSNRVFSIVARTSAGCSVPRSPPSSASTALLKMFCGAQPRVLKASVTPTAVPPEVMEAVFSAMTSDSFSALTVRLPPAVMSASVIVASALDSTTLLAIRPLTAIGVLVPPASDLPPASVPDAAPAPPPASVPEDAPASASAPASAVSAAASSDSVCVTPLTVAVRLATSSASTVTSPPASSVVRSSPARTWPRRSLVTARPPRARPPPLVAARLASASITARSRASTAMLPPTLSSSAVGAVCPADRVWGPSTKGLTQARLSVATLLEASTKLAPLAPAPAVASLLSVAEMKAPCGASGSSSSSAPACTRRSPPTLASLATSRARTRAGCISAPRFVPSRALMPLEKMFCGAHPMVLKASITPTAVPSDDIVALLDAVMVETLSARTSSAPSTTSSLPVTTASARLSTRLVAISPLTARLVGGASGSSVAAPSASSAPGSAPSSAAPSSAALSSPAVSSAAASSTGSASAGASSSAAAEVVCPVRVAEMLADSSANTSMSSTTEPWTRSTRASTALRTSLRTTSPPTAAPPPLPATISASASIWASSSAVTVSVVPVLIETGASPSSPASISASARALTMLLASTSPTPALAPEDVASLRIFALTRSRVRASTASAPPAWSAVARTLAATSAGSSSPMLVPSSASKALNRTF